VDQQRETLKQGNIFCETLKQGNIFYKVMDSNIRYTVKNIPAMQLYNYIHTLITKMVQNNK